MSAKNHKSPAQSLTACLIALSSLTISACNVLNGEPLRIYGESNAEQNAREAADRKRAAEEKAASKKATPSPSPSGSPTPVKPPCVFNPLIKPDLSSLTELKQLQTEIEIKIISIEVEASKNETTADEVLMRQIVAHAKALSIPAQELVEKIMALSVKAPAPKSEPQPPTPKVSPLLASVRALVVHEHAYEYAKSEKYQFPKPEDDKDKSKNLREGLGLTSPEAQKFADELFLRPDAEHALAAHIAAFDFGRLQNGGLDLSKREDALAFAKMIGAKPKPSEVIVAYRAAFRFARAEDGYASDLQAAREYAAKQACTD